MAACHLGKLVEGDGLSLSHGMEYPESRGVGGECDVAVCEEKESGCRGRLFSRLGCEGREAFGDDFERFGEDEGGHCRFE